MALLERRIDHLLEHGYRFKTSTYIDQGFKILQKMWGPFVAFIVLFFIVSAVVGNLEGMVFKAYNPGILGTLIGALWIPGIYFASQKLLHNKPAAFNDLFEGHKQNPGKLIVTSFMVRILTTLPLVPAILSAIMGDDIIYQWQQFMEGLQEQEFLWPEISMLTIGLSIAGFLGAIFLSVSYTFAMHLAFFTNLSAWESLETSRKVVAKKWLNVFGFSILLGLINIGGILALFIGLFFTMPATISSTYVAFEDIFKLEAESENEEEWIEHLVD